MNIKLLNISEFYGSKNDVIYNYIDYLKSIQADQTLDIVQQELIFAYIHKLLNYQKVSDTSTSGFEKFIKYINEEYMYLQNKYPFISIEFQGRIKSLLSVDTKIKKDLKLSLLSGESFEDINIKDILAYRYILDIPKDLHFSPEQTTQLCYDVLESQIEFNLEKKHTLLEAKHTSYSDSKIIQSKAKDNDIFIPSTDFSSSYAKYVKDYIKNPKESLYQALHIRYLLDSEVPFETQIKTRAMHEYAEFGGASHHYYKPRSHFHIHKIPEELGCRKISSNNYNINLLSFDESMKLYYGYNFKDRFGIDFTDFSQKYTDEEKKSILSDRAFITESGLLVPNSLSNLDNIKVKALDISLSELLDLSKEIA